METKLQNLTAQAVKARAEKAPAVILPLASIEILGTHGPVGVDLAVADAVAPMIAEKTGCLVAPAVPYGDTLEFCGMDGTVHVPADSLEAYIYAVAKSLIETCAAKAIVFLCVHSLNTVAAAAACRRLTAEGYRAGIADWWPAVGANAADLLVDRENGRGHGAEMITSVAMAVCGEQMQLELATEERPKDGLAAVNRWNGMPFRTFGNFRLYCESGAWGDLSHASAEKGRLLIERGVDSVAAYIREAFAD